MKAQEGGHEVMDPPPSFPDLVEELKAARSEVRRWTLRVKALSAQLDSRRARADHPRNRFRLSEAESRLEALETFGVRAHEKMGPER